MEVAAGAVSSGAILGWWAISVFFARATGPACLLDLSPGGPALTCFQTVARPAIPRYARAARGPGRAGAIACHQGLMPVSEAVLERQDCGGATSTGMKESFPEHRLRGREHAGPNVAPTLESGFERAPERRGSEAAVPPWPN